ncbi:probable WRKY transcription factor 70 isoform X2 [Rosa chinensis]|uniref:probable WRKY transcription factor 70 isoform X2 n=1 Tax=Rosa chinensis TaxID=74649 RepID=UPI000D096269|nr:probable WRKY transcription factor 70 isoform X2 [Rosa chinensis]
MEWTWPESVSSNRQRVVEELVQGREMVNQLQRCLSGDVRSAEGLVTKILGSFTNTLRILNGSEEAKEELISQIQANSPTSTVTASGSAAAGTDSLSWDALDDAGKSEDSNEESYKSTETFKDRRGSYKRRNYFRCTHKFDQGCKATKHVQRIKDEPQLFRTTYYGNHTCTDYLRAPELILDSSSSQDSSKNMIRFDNTNNDFTRKQEHPFFSSFTSIKKESVKEEEMITPINDHDHVIHHNQQLSSCDYLMSPGLGVFESSASTIAYDHEDVFSRIMVGYFDDEVDFPYEFFL